MQQKDDFKKFWGQLADQVAYRVANGELSIDELHTAGAIMCHIEEELEEKEDILAKRPT